jgi:hypothetical protein
MKMEKDQIIECCAEAAHEMNRIYCKAHGDTSQVPYSQAPEWQKKSAMKGVRGVLAGDTPEESHETWMDGLITDGWKWGPVKDSVKKEHPCLVPYDQLPLEQQQKDHLFITTVGVMALALGWQQ